MFFIQSKILLHSPLLQIETRQKLAKAHQFDNQLTESSNRVLDIYLKEVDIIPKICDKLYAMGRTIEFKQGRLKQLIKVIERKKVQMAETNWNRNQRSRLKNYVRHNENKQQAIQKETMKKSNQEGKKDY